ncbi:hypothetical protein V8D89_007941 [Ganoderma adspersum]
MAFGILEDHKLDNVPGTGLLSDLGHGPPVTMDNARELKHGTGKHSHIILIPQPSDNPRDPLNWPRWKKEACFWTLIFMTTLGGALLPLASPAFLLLAQQFKVSVDEISSSFSTGLPGVAVALLVQNTIAVKFGHRIVYLASSFLMFISSIWTALGPNLASIRAARVLQGIGGAAPSCLVATTLEHLYFVHERGVRSSIWGFSLFAGLTLGPLLNSYVVQNLSWQLGFWFVSVACGLSFLATFFFVPETTYLRAKPANANTSASNRGEGSSNKVDDEKAPRTSAESDVEIRNTGPCVSPPNAPSFLSQLKVYNGTFSNESVWKIFLRPLPFMLSPVTWFVFLNLSMQSVWLSLVVLCSSTIFTVTYNFTPVQTGLTNLGGIVGIVLAALVSGPLNDWWIVWMSQRNRGVYEPEFRLVFMLGMLFGIFGYVGRAVGNDHHMPWIGAVACYTMLYFSAIVTGSACVTYLLDAHGPNALHVLAITDSIRSFVLYGTTFFANGVILRGGVKRSLLVLGACQAACWLSSLPMYVYGKRVRSFIARHPGLFRGDLLASDVPSQSER